MRYANITPSNSQNTYPESVQLSVVRPYIRADRLWAAARTPLETTEASTAVRVLVNTRIQTPGHRCRHCGLIVINSDIHAVASCQRLSAHRLTLLRKCHILPDTNPYEKVTLLL
ncbi:hypothetical protein DPMN_046333 [Dreissena polymorpha]|uniref:Uncharacterized protein n=1 Tax=Dreissena polymorpha TaxID=45954 RepID=A0A9D4D609_DREPO|nr:hypothetical protein DPMN_046333 [Dreissena polymorpha]